MGLGSAKNFPDWQEFRTVSTVRVGTELRQARERAGLSAEQIAERTKIQVHKIDALENGNFEALPDGIYLDGIVRAYAREVGVKPEPLIERVRYEQVEFADAWQADPEDLTAFPNEQVFNAEDSRRVSETRIAAPPIVAAEQQVVAPPNSPAPDDFDVFNQPQVDEQPSAAYEPSRPARRLGRVVLSLVALLAAVGLAVYVYYTNVVTDREATREIDASAPAAATTVDISTADPPTAADQPRSDHRTQTETPTGGTAPVGADRRDANTGAVPRETAGGGDTTAPIRRSIPDAEPTLNDVAPPPPAVDPTVPPVTAENAGTAGRVRDVTGSWALATHVESSSYARFEGLHLGYEIKLQQAGDRVTGTGRKVTQNGDGIGPRAQTPISVAGTIDGDRLTLTFRERGARRPTEGKFVLLLDEGGTLRGRFSSTAARSSGSVEARRLTR